MATKSKQSSASSPASDQYLARGLGLMMMLALWLAGCKTPEPQPEVTPAKPKPLPMTVTEPMGRYPEMIEYLPKESNGDECEFVAARKYNASPNDLHDVVTDNRSTRPAPLDLPLGGVGKGEPELLAIACPDAKECCPYITKRLEF